MLPVCLSAFLTNKSTLRLPKKGKGDAQIPLHSSLLESFSFSKLPVFPDYKISTCFLQIESECHLSMKQLHNLG